MPFNKEIEDFAQAFSSGYSMTQSKEEREAERLKNEYSAGLVEQQGYDVSQRPILEERAAKKFELDVGTGETQLAKAKEDLATAQELNTPEMKAARKAIAEAEALKAKSDAAISAFNASPDNLQLKQDADRAALEASNAARDASKLAGDVSREELRRGKILTDEEQLKLNELQRQDKLHQGLLDGLQRPLPAANQPRVIGGGTQPVPEEAVPTAPTAPTGPAPFVYEPPASSAVGPVNTGHGATFPGVGATRGVSLEVPQGPSEAAVPTEENPGAAPDMVSDIFAGGAERKPIEQMQVADDSSAVETEAGPQKPISLMQVEDDSTAPPVRQQVLDHVASGGGEKMPNGKRVLDVAGKEAVKDGLQQVIRDHGLDQDQAVDTPETEGKYSGYLGGSRAASPDTVKMAEDTVEEQAGETLSQNEKTYYTLGTTWLYHNGIGDADGAKNAAASLLQHYQMVFSQYASVAQAASSNGDIDGAMEASVRAYANVPTGDELHLSWTKDHKHIIATTTNMDGVTTQKQLMTPEEMGAYVMNVNPSSFVSLIAQAAGREDKDIKAAGSFAEAASGELGVDVTGWTTAQINAYRQSKTDKAKDATEAKGKALTPEQRNQVVGSVSAAFEAVADNALRNGEGDLAEKLTGNSDLMMNIRPITEQIAMDNPELRPELAVSAVVKMIDQAPTSASIDGDKITIKVEGTPAFSMDKDLYYRLADVRSKFAAPEDVTQDQYNQQLSDLRRTPEFGLGSDLRPYDPNRNQDNIVEELTPPTRYQPSADHKVTRPSEAVSTEMPAPWIRQHPAVGGGAVVVPQWLLHPAVRPKKAIEKSTSSRPRDRDAR